MNDLFDVSRYNKIEGGNESYLFLVLLPLFAPLLYTRDLIIEGGTYGVPLENPEAVNSHIMSFPWRRVVSCGQADGSKRGKAVE